jgi:enterochelin esterase-like enzyme
VRIPVAHKPTDASGEGRRALVLAITGAGALFLLVGALGLYRYLRGFWLYRGFPPPHDPAFVQAAGRAETTRVTSAAVGGRSQRVLVYLPPGYDPTAPRRYPVLYLLHGFPGDPDAFLRALRMGVVEDTLLAEHKIQPVILVMPFGSTGIFTNKEWANGIHAHEGWETFVARDVVGAIDRRYRTIRSGAARALAGLSEGGYGSLNIGLHHPGEFHLLESWSGYEKADDVRSIFGGRRSLLARNSPSVTLPRAAPALRRDGSFIWFYSGTRDRLRPENARFAAELGRFHVPHLFLVKDGGHDWGLWRDEAWAAVTVASEHLAHA